MRAPFDEDIGFQRRVWAAERISWTLLALLLLAALAGAFGEGLFSEVEARPADRSFRVSYLRFARKQAPVTLRIDIHGDETHDGQMTLWISAAYLERFTVSSITPEPREATLDGDRVLFHFGVTDSRDSAVIRISMEADDAGSASGELGLGSQAVPIRQFFYP